VLQLGRHLREDPSGAVVLVEADGGGRRFQNELPIEEEEYKTMYQSRRTQSREDRTYAYIHYLTIRQRLDEVLHEYPRALDLDNPHPDDEPAMALPVDTMEAGLMPRLVIISSRATVIEDTNQIEKKNRALKISEAQRGKRWS
jgi:hypothetical protein